MSDLPIQPTQGEIDQFPEMPEVFEPVHDNTDHEDIAEEIKATVPEVA
jgi:hypothetical protein